MLTHYIPYSPIHNKDFNIFSAEVKEHAEQIAANPKTIPLTHSYGQKGKINTESYPVAQIVRINMKMIYMNALRNLHR